MEMSTASQIFGRVEKFGEQEFEEYLNVFGQEIARVRYLYVRDASAGKRAEWLDQTFGSVETYEFSDSSTYCLTNADGDFDILVFGCHDISRIKSYLRANAPLLDKKVKICLLFGGNAQRRAKALAAGFDDVFDISKVFPVEGLARTYAIWRRYQMTIAERDSQHAHQLALEKICDIKHITPRQMRALECLAASPNRLVQYRSLCDMIGGNESYISDANLKVIVCHLRKLLRPGFKILSQHNLGYILKTRDGM